MSMTDIVLKSIPPFPDLLRIALTIGATSASSVIIFGVVNYLMMLRRYENDIKKKKYLQKEKISRLYPKGSFIF